MAQAGEQSAEQRLCRGVTIDDNHTAAGQLRQAEVGHDYDVEKRQGAGFGRIPRSRADDSPAVARMLNHAVLVDEAGDRQRALGDQALDGRLGNLAVIAAGQKCVLPAGHAAVARQHTPAGGDLPRDVLQPVRPRRQRVIAQADEPGSGGEQREVVEPGRFAAIEISGAVVHAATNPDVIRQVEPGCRSTIQDLSSTSGLSASTISAVLNDTWKKRRIRPETAELVRVLAQEQNYMPNRQAQAQAQALRTARSSLVGLIIPSHGSRYFASIAQAFETQVRQRGQCPVVVSAGRDPRKERETAQILMSYAIDSLFICGAADPDGVHGICHAAGLRHVNIDLPGRLAPSVISDNRVGGFLLTQSILGLPENGAWPTDGVHFFGGHDDVATRERIEGCRDAIASLGGKLLSRHIHLVGYDTRSAALAFDRFHKRHGTLPSTIFINSSGSLEGLLHFLNGNPSVSSAELRVGCYDYDPFAASLPFMTGMIKQNVTAMIQAAFALLDEPAPKLIAYHVLPELIVSRRIVPAQPRVT